MKKLTILLFICFCVLVETRAQYDVHFTHYWDMINFYNPAGAGSTKKLHAYAAYSNQMSGFENNPKSMLINVDLPITILRGDHSAGAGVINDEIGIFTNQHLYINYAFGMKLFGGRMAIGAQLALLNAKIEPGKLEFGGESNDPAFPTSSADGNTFDFGAGILYQHKLFYAGISALHINAPQIDIGEKNRMQVDPYFNFTAGGNIPLKNPLITIQPSVQLMTDFVSWRTDITARGSYNYKEKIFFGGVTYSPSTSVAMFLGIEFMDITVSYGYELFTSGVGAENGSHDIYLGYKMDLDIFKKEKNKHNSIRILQ